ncbi:MAG: hypothetical protein E7058_02970 [Lentisphaerae bacterium]|nr:hypothetical protein [Lentisphaerota bacterium]
MIKVAQCWDDGVLNDIKLTELLRKYNAKATFNLNPALHRYAERNPEGYKFRGIYYAGKLAWNEVTDVYEGFDVASHTMCHCNAGIVDDKVFFTDAVGAKNILEDLFQKPCTGFAWPCGRYTEKTADMLLEAGFTYGRTVENTDRVSAFSHPMILHSSCHFQDDNFWQAFEKAKTTDGIFYFWGHSYEMMDDPELWADFENKLRRLSEDPEVVWIPTTDLVK